MIIDGEKITPVKEFQFFKTGNHKVYYKFKNHLDMLAIIFLKVKIKIKF